MKKELYKSHNYLNKDLKYIKNALIREYDMKNAGLSILKHNGLIYLEDYDDLMNNHEKHERDVIVGKFLGDNPDISKALMQGFQEARKEFFEINNIQDSDVLTIKKDAIFLINKIPEIEQINDDYLFRNKNEYTSYLNLRNKELYYNAINDVLDIKGFHDEVIESQKEYLFKFIKECLKLDSEGRKDDLFIKLLEFKNNFVNKQLPIEFYRDINENCYLFYYKGKFLGLEDIKTNFNNMDYLYLNNNLNLILELISNILS